jgi:hypothetical protein
MIIPQRNAEVDWPLAWPARKYTLLVAMLKNTYTRHCRIGIRRRVAVLEMEGAASAAVLLHAFVPPVPRHGRPFRCDQEQFLYSLTNSSFRVSRLVFLQLFIIQGELILSQHTTEKRNQSKIRPA